MVIAEFKNEGDMVIVRLVKEGDTYRVQRHQEGEALMNDCHVSDQEKAVEMYAGMVRDELILDAGLECEKTATVTVHDYDEYRDMLRVSVEGSEYSGFEVPAIVFPVWGLMGEPHDFNGEKVALEYQYRAAA